MKNYIIVAAMFKLPIADNIQKNTFGKFFLDRLESLRNSLNSYTHNFWYLQDMDTGKIVAELHGFATDRKTKIIKAVGTPLDQLVCYHFVRDETFASKHQLSICTDSYAEISQSHVVYADDDALARWFQAVNLSDKVNKGNLNYNPLGCNSNSIYAMLAEHMSIDCYEFQGYNALGIRNKIQLDKPLALNPNNL